MPVMWGRPDHWRRTSVRLIRDQPTKLLLFWSSLPALFATLTLPAYADFSYVRTTKSSADTSVQTTRQFLKGQKLRMEHGNVASSRQPCGRNHHHHRQQAQALYRP